MKPVKKSKIVSQILELELTKKQTQAIEDRLSQMPETCRKTYQKAMTGKARTAGVKAFCRECVGWKRIDVKKCTDLGCPLYFYRPDQHMKEKELPQDPQ